MEKILVIGACGVLGQEVVKELIYQKREFIVSDYKEERVSKFADELCLKNYVVIDVRDITSIESGLIGVNLVIVTVKQEKALIQEVCCKNNIQCVDVTVNPKIINEVLKLDLKQSSSIVMSGFFPGISGLMIKDFIDKYEKINSIKLGLLQNYNAKVGITGINDMLKIINENNNVKGFSNKHIFNIEQLNKDFALYEIEHIEKQIILDYLKVKEVKYFTGWNRTLNNFLIKILKKLNLINYISNNKKILKKLVKHNPNLDEKVYLTIEANVNNNEIKKRTISETSDYKATSKSVIAIGLILLESKKTKLVFPWQLTNLEEVISINK